MYTIEVGVIEHEKKSLAVFKFKSEDTLLKAVTSSGSISLVWLEVGIEQLSEANKPKKSGTSG